MEVARARVDEAQQALIKELDRAKERERQAAAERAAASRDWAVQEQAAARDRAAAQRAMQAAAAQARSLTSNNIKCETLTFGSVKSFCIRLYCCMSFSKASTKNCTCITGIDELVSGASWAACPCACKWQRRERDSITAQHVFKQARCVTVCCGAGGYCGEHAAAGSPDAAALVGAAGRRSCCNTCRLRKGSQWQHRACLPDLLVRHSTHRVHRCVATPQWSPVVSVEQLFVPLRLESPCCLLKACKFSPMKTSRLCVSMMRSL